MDWDQQITNNPGISVLLFSNDREKKVIWTGMAVTQQVYQPCYPRPSSQKEWHVQKCGVVKCKMSLRNTDGCDVTVWYKFPFQVQGEEVRVCVFGGG